MIHLYGILLTTSFTVPELWQQGKLLQPSVNHSFKTTAIHNVWHVIIREAKEFQSREFST